jgi:hypothetical protein
MITKRKQLFSRAFLALIRKIALRIGLSSALLASIAGCPSQNASNQQIPPKFDTSKTSFKTKGVFDNLTWSNISETLINSGYYKLGEEISLNEVSKFVAGAGGLVSLSGINPSIAKAIGTGATLEFGQIMGIAQATNYFLEKTGNQNFKVDIYLKWNPIVFGPPYFISASKSNFDGTSSYQDINIGNQVTQQVNLHEEKKFRFKMESGKRYVISLRNNYREGDADIYSSNQVNFNRSNSQGSSSKSSQEVDRIEFVAPYSGDNYIIVFGFSASSFNLNVDEVWSWWR